MPRAPRPPLPRDDKRRCGRDHFADRSLDDNCRDCVPLFTRRPELTRLPRQHLGTQLIEGWISA